MFWLLVLANIIALGVYDNTRNVMSSNVCKRDYDPFPPAGMCLEAGALHDVDSGASNDSMIDPSDYIYVFVVATRVALDIYCIGSLCIWLCR